MAESPAEGTAESAAEGTAGMVLIDVTLETAEATRDELVALLRSTMAGSQAEPGCLIYRFTADLDDPLRFHLVELWESEAALKQHFAGEAFGRFIATVQGCGSIVRSLSRKGPLAPFTLPRPA